MKVVDLKRFVFTGKELMMLIQEARPELFVGHNGSPPALTISGHRIKFQDELILTICIGEKIPQPAKKEGTSDE